VLTTTGLLDLNIRQKNAKSAEISKDTFVFILLTMCGHVTVYISDLLLSIVLLHRAVFILLLLENLGCA